jgi:hypothetical protein
VEFFSRRAENCWGYAATGIRIREVIIDRSD